MTDLKCPACEHEFDFAEAEQHEASMTDITIACPECSGPLVYHRVED